MSGKYSVLFVCAGNICRSPTAEWVFRRQVEERGIGAKFNIESCGTGGWHEGEQANRHSRRVAEARGVSMERHRARQVRREDFKKFDLILAMDSENLAALQRMNGAPDAKIRLLREFDPQPDDLDVPDPYYGGLDGFEKVFDIVERSCAALLDELQREAA